MQRNSTIKWLSALTFIGFSLRLYVAYGAVAISPDSIEYLHLAREFSMSITRPPLYPVLTGLLYPLFGDPEPGGRVVSLLFGTLLIPAVFYLGRLVFGEKTGLYTAFLAAFHPYLVRYSGEVLTEAVFHFMTTLAVFFGIKTILEKNARYGLLCGLFAALSYLTKPAGVVFLLPLSALALYNARGDGKKAAVLFASLWAVFFVLALPYLAFLYENTATLALTGKLSIRDYLFSVIKDPQTNLKDLIQFFRLLPQAFTAPPFVLFLVYLFLRSRNRWRGMGMEEKTLLSVIVFYSVVLIIVFPSKRYIVQLMPVFLVLSASALGSAESRLIAKKRVVFASLVFLLTAFQMPKALATLKKHRLPEKEAGRWIRETLGEGNVIMARKPIVAYYAKGKHLKLPEGKLEEVFVRANGALYVADYEERLKESFPGFQSKEELFLVRLKSFGQRDEFTVYRIR
jgi:4-amino-4-deoxy-L-arabinose transferase-like glycosyltransferase